MYMINDNELNAQQLRRRLTSERRKVKRLESFMEAVAKEVGCLPDYSDYLPDGGNAHVMRKLRSLSENAKGHTRNGGNEE